MFHMEPAPETVPTLPQGDVVPLFVNLPIFTEQDLERALVQEQAA